MDHYPPLPPPNESLIHGDEDDWRDRALGKRHVALLCSPELLAGLVESQRAYRVLQVVGTEHWVNEDGLEEAIPVVELVLCQAEPGIVRVSRAGRPGTA